MLSLLEIIKYAFLYRAICIAAAVAVAIILYLIKGSWAHVPYAYLVMDTVFSVILLPTIWPAGWRVLLAHVFISLAWIGLVWQILPTI